MIKQSVSEEAMFDLDAAMALRELSDEELQQVSGGLFPALGFAGALIGHTGVLGASGGSIGMGVGVAAHLISGLGLGMAAYSFGTAYGGFASRFAMRRR